LEDLKTLETSVLVDMLAQRTKEYTEMLFSDHRDMLDDYESTITKIQEIINSRRQTSANTSVSDANINFSSESEETT